MAFVNPTTPNLADFITFCQDQGVTTAILPANSDYFTWSYNVAFAVVSVPPGDMAPILYVLAVYNCGMHQLLKIGQDSSGTFFADARKTYGLNTFTAGAVIASADQGTSETLSNPEFLAGLTFGDLDLMKTVWGRSYLEYAQAYGPNIVDVS